MQVSVSTYPNAASVDVSCLSQIPQNCMSAHSSYFLLLLSRGEQKCDGVKPICGPCERNPKEDECDYTDVQGRSRTRALEDTIARLETRIKELERPQDFTPSVSLHDPYNNQIQLQPSPASPYTSLSPFSPVSSTSSHSFGTFQLVCCYNGGTYHRGIDQGGRGSSSTSASDSSLSFLGTNVRVTF